MYKLGVIWKKLLFDLGKLVTGASPSNALLFPNGLIAWQYVQKFCTIRAFCYFIPLLHTLRNRSLLQPKHENVWISYFLLWWQKCPNLNHSTTWCIWLHSPFNMWFTLRHTSLISVLLSFDDGRHFQRLQRQMSFMKNAPWLSFRT